MLARTDVPIGIPHSSDEIVDQIPMDDPARIQEIPIKIRHTTKTRTRGKQTVQEVNHKEPSLHARLHKTATT